MLLQLELPIDPMLSTKHFGDQGGLIERYLLVFKDDHGRNQILMMLMQNLTLEGNGRFDLLKIARATPGFVGADLKALVDKAGNLAMKRIIVKDKEICGGEDNNKHDWWRHPWNESEMECLCITMADLEVSQVIVWMAS